MVLRFVFALIFCAAFLSCADTERDSPNDPGSPNYISDTNLSSGGGGSSSSSVGSSSSNGGSSSSDDGGSSSSSSVAPGSISYGTLSYEDQDYKTVKIGDQVWMAENLNYAASGSKCVGASEKSGTLVDKGGRCGTYGRLYDWATSMAVCPYGWHLPSDADWDELMTTVGGSSDAGAKLKATSGWNSSGNGSDEYGFSALPGGVGYSDGSFSYVGSTGSWWSATDNGSYNAYSLSMGYDYEDADWNYSNKTNLFSVRCVQN